MVLLGLVYPVIDLRQKFGQIVYDFLFFCFFVKQMQKWILSFLSSYIF